MAKLTESQKLAIVQALACFDTPSEVAAAVKEEFGVTISRQQVAAYDPTKATGRDLSKKLRALFEETRRTFLSDVAAIPIAQQAFRLRALQREFERAKSRGNSALAAQLLEQAAKELGGAFTNRRELTGQGGGPIQQANLTQSEFAEVARRIAAEV
jgi:hypothetical protein